MSRHFYKPMLAKPVYEPFSGDDWVFEVKWDGFRAIAYVNETLSLKSRNDKDLTGNFPELKELTHLCRNVVLDGEIIIMHQGKPDFQRLLKRGQAVSAKEIQQQTQQALASYIVFDILEKDGNSTVDLPLLERKKLLQNSVKEGKNVFLSDFIDTKGEDYFRLVEDKGLEGVVAKRKDSLYEEGQRSGSWLKIKKLKTCDCIIFGYTKGERSREATFGALLLGLYDKKGVAVYLGKVGTGFTDEALKTLTQKFQTLQT
jgi:DNA ligase D-like protein (predicted ligase)